MVISTQPLAKLLWFTESNQQELMLHREDIITIGRGDANTIVINSVRVSRNHARIEWKGEAFFIRDMSSSNGTFVNGHRVEYGPLELRDGDLIMLERIPIHFEVLKLPRAEQSISMLPTIPAGKGAMEDRKASLVITQGVDIGKEFAFDEDEFIIGRESINANWKVRINDVAVSRPQAKIEHNNDVYMLIDLGSANGTTLNDRFVIAPVILKDGDVIGIGSTRLEFKLT